MIRYAALVLTDPPPPRSFTAAGWIAFGALVGLIAAFGLLLGAAWMQL